MKRLLFLSFIICALSLTVFSCKHSSVSDKFVQKAIQENKSYPLKLNDSIIVDSTHFDVHSNTLSYFFTVLSDLDNEQLFKDNYDLMKAALKAGMENSPYMKPYLDAHCTIRYVYYSERTRKKIEEFAFN